ncbi:hypothetical protein [Hankyongella ginsenosidimutans]|uniref:hypothetical protein n=1 Tax=Hankyongella ginsenosidimutans TaxID=1763828 RepID=UPI001FE7D644|nr:hypothetical protein [Hankyongella ginsenosidimutans]
MREARANGEPQRPDRIAQPGTALQLDLRQRRIELRLEARRNAQAVGERMLRESRRQGEAGRHRQAGARHVRKRCTALAKVAHVAPIGA